MSLQYRPEIDGLRALAVAAVVLYHAGLGGAGFVGVDVFFVISGYLITALLLRERMQTGGIQLGEFYARRVRRIVPAVTVVIVAVLAAVPFLPASARAGVTASAVAASLFGANFYFQWQTAGYFSGGVDQFPLLHLWSLAVEEQFYLVWPLLLSLVGLRRLTATIGVLAVASFAYAEWLIFAGSNAAFYSMPARFWELAVGGLIAAGPAVRLPRASSWIGIALVIIASVLPAGHFPALGAAPAVIGAGVVIASLHGGATNILLRSRPLVALGLVSYSLYLWHWPLLAVDRLLRVGPAPWTARAFIVLAALALAVLSYRYIETPFRRLRAGRARTLGAGFAAMGLVGIVGWQWPAPPPAGPPPAVRASFYTAACRPFTPGEPSRVQRPECAAGQRKVVIWGDSYAHSWEPMVEALADRRQAIATTWALDACPPIGIVARTWIAPQEVRNCEKWNRDALDYLRKYGADTLVIAFRWDNLVTAENSAEVGSKLEKIMDQVAPWVGRVVVIAPTPALPDRLDKCASIGRDCSMSRSGFDAQAAPARTALQALGGRRDLIIDEPAEWLCGADSCSGFRSGKPLYEDDGAHVTRETAAAYASVRVPKWFVDN